MRSHFTTSLKDYIQRLRKLVQIWYKRKARPAKPISMRLSGTANCYKISCEEGTYFFKEYQKEFTLQAVERETELVDYLYSKDYPMESSLDEKWAESISVDAVNAKYDRLLEALEKEKTDPNYNRIKEDFLFKKELFCHIEDMKRYFKGITYTPSHGDYTACQLICDEDHVKAVIDFASAAKLPAVWEIIAK